MNRKDEIYIFPVAFYWSKRDEKTIKVPQLDKGVDWKQTENNVLLSDLPDGQNYGVNCGASKLVVIDFDKGAESGSVPGVVTDTMLVRTQGGGAHFYYSFEDTHRIKTGVGLAPNVDVRANGGYVVGPGSRCKLPDGSIREYRMVRGWEHLRPLPTQLLTTLQQRGFVLRKETFNPKPSRQVTDDVDRDEITTALSFIRAADRDTWLKVAMALHSAGMMNEFLDWSRTQPKYVSDDDCMKTWRSLKKESVPNGKGYTLGTIIYLAREAGWQRSNKG